MFIKLSTKAVFNFVIIAFCLIFLLHSKYSCTSHVTEQPNELNVDEQPSEINSNEQQSKTNEAEQAKEEQPQENNEQTKFRSYSQFFEDLILHDALLGTKNGFYIDVGANDPNIDSVTKHFYEECWHGINIEPLKKEHNKLVKERKRDINLCICAGKTIQTCDFYENNGLSTLNKNIAKRWGNTPEPRKVKVEPLRDICKKYCPKNQIIQFCSIDTEGSEREVLLGFDFLNFRPKIFCIESTEPCSIIPTHQKFEKILVENGYSFAFEHSINRFYIDKNSPECSNIKFIGVEELKKKYQIEQQQ